MLRITIFSDCRKYRYTLWRDWSSSGTSINDMVADMFAPRVIEPGKLGHLGRYAMFIGLNPSTADEVQDDPTIRRCIQFSKDWGFGAYCMTNLFAWRDTQPENMKRSPEPIGAENDSLITEIADEAGIIICAWGKHGSFKSRDLSVMKLLQPYSKKVHCLKTNKDGSPQHPLYIAANTEPKLFT